MLRSRRWSNRLTIKTNDSRRWYGEHTVREPTSCLAGVSDSLYSIFSFISFFVTNSTWAWWLIHFTLKINCSSGLELLQSIFFFFFYFLTDIFYNRFENVVPCDLSNRRICSGFLSPESSTYLLNVELGQREGKVLISLWHSDARQWIQIRLQHQRRAFTN
jgi:hypothetical protein